MIASVIAQDLRQRSKNDEHSRSRTFVAIAYCFKNDENKRDALAVIKTLAWHLIDQTTLLPNEKLAIAHYWRKGEPIEDPTSPSAIQDLRYTLVLLLRDLLACRSTYLIIDGLDECHSPHEEGRKLVEAFRTISAKSKVHVLFTSQTLPELSDLFLNDFESIDLDNNEAKANRGRDIDLIVSRALQQSGASEFVQDLKSVKTKLLQKADGVVLWATLALGNTIKKLKIIDKNDSDVIRIVEELPTESVEIMYKHMLARLEESLLRNNDQKVLEMVVGILRWTIWAVRSLTLEELCIALSMETHTRTLRTPDDVKMNLNGSIAKVRRQITTVCYPLLRIQQDDTVAITHSTFKDYVCGLEQISPNLGLISSRLRLTEAACTLTRSCLSYLLLFDDYKLIIRDDFDVEKFDSEHKFYAYAAFNLKIHGNQASPAMDAVYQLSTYFDELIHKKQGLTWISRLFSDGKPNIHEDELQWSFNVGLAKLRGKKWLLALLKDAIEHYKEATMEVSQTQTSMMKYLASLLKSQGSYDEAEHVLRDLLALTETTKSRDDELISIKASIGLNLSSSGRLEEAAEILEETLSQYTTKYGDNNRNTMIAQNNLACCYQSQGRFYDAIKLFTETASRETDRLGREDRNTICTFNNLAHCHGCCGQWTEARNILEENLGILKSGNYGEPALLLCMNNVATAYDVLGSLQKAEDLHREVWARRLIIYGESHEDTLTSLNNVAYACLRQTRYQAASELYQKNLQLAQLHFGPHNRMTITVAGNYADALWGLGKNQEALQLRTYIVQTLKSLPPNERDNASYALHAARLAGHRQAEWDWEEAERLLVEALKVQYRKLGPEHHDLAAALTSLASNCSEKNLLRAALELTNRAYMIERSSLGERNPNTITSLVDKGVCHHLLGNYKDARTCMEEGLVLGKSVLGQEHLGYVTARGYFAALLADLGELETARDIYIEERDFVTSHYGPDDKTGLYAQTHLAQVYQKLGNLNLARTLHEEALERRRKKYGDAHLLTASSQYDLAHLLQEMGFFKDAIGLANAALDVRRTSLGPKHRVTLASEHKIGLIYQGLGEYRQAEEHLQISVNERYRLLGLSHAHTLDSLHDLALLYKRTGWVEEAICLLRCVVDYRNDILSSQHQNTLESETVLQDLRKMRANPRRPDAPIELRLLSGLDFIPHSHLDALENLHIVVQAPDVKRIQDIRATLQEMSMILGEDFPFTLDVSTRLASEFTTQGKYQDALPLFEKAWRMQYSALQSANPHAARLLVDYVTCLKRTGMLENALSGTLKHALAIATLTENKTLLKLLLEAKVDPNIKCDDGSTPLLHATSLGNKAKRVVSELLKLGAEQVARNDGRTPLMIAFENGDDEIFDLLLDAGGDHEQFSSNGQSLLYQAAAQGRLHALQALLDVGADPNQKTPQGYSSFHIATIKGHLKIMKCLVKAGASLTLTTAEGGFTPVYLAADLNNEKALEYLLSVGASPATLSENGFGSVHTAVAKGFVGVVTQLLDAGLDIEQVSENADQCRPLHVAAQYADVSVVRELVRRGAKIETSTSTGGRAVHLACEHGKTATVEFLLDRGADPNVVTQDKITPFYCAALSGDIDKLTLLLEKGKADPQTPRNGAILPLHAAAARGHSHVVDLIMSRTECDPNVQTEVGGTALHMAAERGHVQVIDTLLSNWNANAKMLNNGGYSALHFAALSGHKDVVRLLMNYDSQLAEVRDKEGFAPLHLATLGITSASMEELLHAGADPNVEAPGPLSPLMLAIWKHLESAVECLVKNRASLRVTDCFGMNCMDWAALNYFTHPALEKKKRQIKQTTPKQRDEALSRNIAKLAQTLLDSSSRLESPYVSDSMGRCLLRAGNTLDALRALQIHSIASTSAAAVSSVDDLTYDAACSLCGAEKIIGVRYLCKVCPDYDLCTCCMEKLQSKREKLNGCVDHEYLELANIYWTGPKTDHLDNVVWRNGDGELVDDWLERLSTQQ